MRRRRYISNDYDTKYCQEMNFYDSDHVRRCVKKYSRVVGLKEVQNPECLLGAPHAIADLEVQCCVDRSSKMRRRPKRLEAPALASLFSTFLSLLTRAALPSSQLHQF